MSGAPVTAWENYDTGYTERYMGHPVANAGAYAASSILNQIDGFPDEDDRVIIAHGLRDENVLFTNTSQLTSALLKAGKPFRVQVCW